MANRYADLQYLRSYESLKRVIYGEDVYTADRAMGYGSNASGSSGIARSAIPQWFATVDYAAEENRDVMIAIQNDPKLISILLKFRKQKKPTVYVFVESNVYITFIIKSVMTYPLIFLRIPVNNIYTFARETNQVFEFPISSILEKTTKFAKSVSYSIILKKNDTEYMLQYTYNNIVHKIREIQQYTRAVIDEVFMTDERLIAAGMSQQVDYLYAFYNSDILIIAKTESNTIMQFASCEGNFRLEITENTLIRVNEISPKDTNEEIITTASTALLWSWFDRSTRAFALPRFDNLFKQDYLRGILTNDKVYYLFGTLGTMYTLIRIITPLDITEFTNRSLMQIFCKNYQIVEMYLCAEIHK
jgi:hypothetical protein